jgi:hypothetical protein
MLARWLLLAGIVACHKTEAVAPDAALVDAATSPCVTNAARTADALGQLDLHALALKCTGQTPEAAVTVQKTAPFGNGSLLVYVQTLAADGGTSMLVAEVDSPPQMIAWSNVYDVQLGRPAVGNTFGSASGIPALHPSLHARFDTLRGETVIVEGVSSVNYAFVGMGSRTADWERVWLRRGHELVFAGAYPLSGEAETGTKPTDPVRSFVGKTIFHGDRVEIREDVTWSWYRQTYSDIEGEHGILLASTKTTYEHAWVLRGDKLEPDAPPEPTPEYPNKKKP